MAIILTGVPSIQQHDKKYFVGTLSKIGLYLMYVCLRVDFVSLIKVLAILLPFFIAHQQTHQLHLLKPMRIHHNDSLICIEFLD